MSLLFPGFTSFPESTWWISGLGGGTVDDAVGEASRRDLQADSPFEGAGSSSRQSANPRSGACPTLGDGGCEIHPRRETEFQKFSVIRQCGCRTVGCLPAAAFHHWGRGRCRIQFDDLARRRRGRRTAPGTPLHIGSRDFSIENVESLGDIGMSKIRAFPSVLRTCDTVRPRRPCGLRHVLGDSSSNSETNTMCCPNFVHQGRDPCHPGNGPGGRRTR